MGYGRDIQNHLRRRSIGAGIVGVLFSIFLSAYSRQYRSTWEHGSSIVSMVSAPVVHTVHSVYRSGYEYLAYYSKLSESSEKNEMLQQQLAVLRTRLLALEEEKIENRRLRKLLGVIEKHRLDGLYARVTGLETNSWSGVIRINRGSTDGIELNSAVISHGGIVGQVVEVSLSSSRVMLVTDSRSGLDVRLQESRVRGVLKGNGEGECELNFIHNDQPVTKGDNIVTSGLDDIYPPGLLVGEVKRVKSSDQSLFKIITVNPAIDLDTLEDVYVITPVFTIPEEEKEKGRTL